MKTRTGKIARLPKSVRDELNRRMEDGERGKSLVRWLNELPEVQKVVAELFGGKTIREQNLSDWRKGGYVDWVRHRDVRTQVRLTIEETDELGEDEGGLDLSESVAQLVSAELMLQVRAMQEMCDPEERWKRFRHVARELSRLRRDDQRFRRQEFKREQWEATLEPVEEASGAGCQVSGGEGANDECGMTNGAGQALDGTREKSGYIRVYPGHQNAELGTRSAELKDEHPTSNTQHRTSNDDKKGHRGENTERRLTEGNEENEERKKEVRRIDFNEPAPRPADAWRGAAERIYAVAPCGCICRKCHAEDGPYPYWEAEKDAALCRKSKHGGFIPSEKGGGFHISCWKCDCTCARCDEEGQSSKVQIPSSNGMPNGECDGDSGNTTPAKMPRRSVHRVIYTTKCRCRGNCKKCHAEDGEYPMSEVLRDEQLSREGKLRGEDGVSRCLWHRHCECECEECANKAEGRRQNEELVEGRLK